MRTSARRRWDPGRPRSVAQYVLPHGAVRWLVTFLLHYWNTRPSQDIGLFVSAAVAMAEWQATGASPAAALERIDPRLTVRQMVTLAPAEVEGGVAMFWSREEDE